LTRGWALFWGLVLVLLGGLALLFNLGFLQPEQLSRLAALWPLLLIVVGLQIVLARLLPRAAAAIALSVLTFLLVFGAIGYAVTAPVSTPSSRQVGVRDVGTAPATLRVELGAAQIDIRYAGTGASALLNYRGGSPRLTWDEGTRTLSVSHTTTAAGLLSPSSPDRLQVTLAGSATWTVVLDAGASSTTVSLASPVGHERLTLNGGATELTIYRPAGAPLGVNVNGGANSVSVDGRSVGSAIGATSWSSPGFPATDDVLVTVNGGANRVTVRTSG
jgi:cell wall-active antibiotic response 4TMS protein YvqF